MQQKRDAHHQLTIVIKLRTRPRRRKRTLQTAPAASNVIPFPQGRATA